MQFIALLQRLVILSECSESKDLHLHFVPAERIPVIGNISMHERFYYTYIVARRSLTLYIGITNDLDKRVFEHKMRLHNDFSADYNCNRLVWFERYAHASSAIAREKQLKGWTRTKKIALIRKSNPTWVDLSGAWYTPGQLLGADC
jgi:putative endonuclease